MIAFARGLFVDSRLMQRVNLGARRARLTLGLCRECDRPRAVGSKNFCECHRAKHAADSSAWGRRQTAARRACA